MKLNSQTTAFTAMPKNLNSNDNGSAMLTFRKQLVVSLKNGRSDKSSKNIFTQFEQGDKRSKNIFT